MKWLQRTFTDPALYVLVAFNAYFIYEYIQHPENYATIVWVFWCQSVLIGFFNFFELLTTKNVNATGFTVNNKQVDPQKGSGCYASFFLLHYGGFHAGYFIFTALTIGFRDINPLIFKISLILLFANQTFIFFRHKQRYQEAPPSLQFLFFAPYLRIVPMHLMILGPAFLKMQPAMIFLVLKTLMDIAGYLLTAKPQQKMTHP